MATSMKVNVLGRDFNLAHEEHQEHQLRVAVTYLHTRMKEMNQQGVQGFDRAAFLAALSITHELLQSRVGGTGFEVGVLRERVQGMSDLLDAALVQGSRISS